MKKMISALLVSLTCLALCTPAMAEPALTGRYISNQNVDFFSSYPEYTFKMATFGIEVLELFDDGTYRLLDTESSFSGALAFEDDGTYDVVPRGGDVRVYTGTYDALSDSGLLMVTLSAPETLEISSTNSISAMTTEEGTEEDPMEKYGFEETDIMIDEATGEFDYFSVGPQI